MIEEIDWSVGQILETLKRNRLDENTLVIFTSDNGPWLCTAITPARPARCAKERGRRSTAACACPSSPAGRARSRAGSTCHEPAMTIDLLPTIAKLIGAELPRAQDRRPGHLAAAYRRSRRQVAARGAVLLLAEPARRRAQRPLEAAPAA